MAAKQPAVALAQRAGARPALRLRAPGAESLALIVCALLLALLVVVPVLMLLHDTFRAESRFGPSYYTLENFRFLVSPRILTALGNTAIVTGGGTLLAGLLGVSLALIIARTDTPGRRLFEFLVVVPFFLSPYVGALAWSYLGSPQIGLLNGLIKGVTGLEAAPINIYTHGGMIWVLGLFFTPYFYLFVLAPLRRMDTSLEEAARTCGCSHLEVARRVTLPLVLPSMLSAGLLSFVSGAGEFGIPLALGTPYGIDTLSTELFMLTSDMPPKLNAAAATGSVLLIVALALIYVQRRIILPRDFTTVTGKSGQPRLLALGRWRHATAAFVWLYLALAVFAPMTTILLIALSRSWRGTPDLSSLTFANFQFVVASPIAMRGIQHSLLLALVGATVAMALGTVLAWLIFRSRAPGRGLLDVVSTVPVGIPGIVLAMGILLAYIRTPLYGTLGLILLGYVARFLPTAQRSVGGTILSLSPELEASARVSGAGWLTIMRRVTLPLLMPGVISGWTILFVIFLREFPISILLYRDGIEVLSVSIWNVLQNEPTPRAAALMFVQFLLVLVSLVIFRRLVGKDMLS